MSSSNVSAIDIIKFGLDRVMAENKLVLMMGLGFGLVSTVLMAPFGDANGMGQMILERLGQDDPQATANQPDLPVIPFIISNIVSYLAYIAFLLPWARVGLGSPLAPLEGGVAELGKLAFRILLQCLVCFIGIAFLVLSFASLLGIVTPVLGVVASTIIFFILAFWIGLAGAASILVLIAVQGFGRPTQLREVFFLMRTISTKLVLAEAYGLFIATLAVMLLFVMTTVALPLSIANSIVIPLSSAVSFYVAAVLISGLDALPQIQMLKQAPPLGDR